MNKEILLGDEALARAAVDAGISGAYSYPGTPATEIFESVESQVRREHLDIHVRWSSNEKVAYEEALGMSYAGKRALVSFKHVGLNVAADSLVLIDEPELSLHVVWQQHFLKDMSEVIKLTGFDILIATHSPQIIHDRWDLAVELKDPRE